MLREERKEELIELTRALVSKRSESGHEAEAAGVLERYMRGRGFDQVTVDGLGSVIGMIAGNRPGPRVLFDGHLDTVPVADPAAWTHDPYGCEIAGGRMYGRGTSDMKGAVAAFTAAAHFFAQDRNRDFPGEIYIAGTVHEECFEGVAARSVSRIVRPDYVVIGEASQCDLKIGQRGRAEIVVETFGVPAHSANPEKGVNAVYAMCKAVEAIRQLPCPEHPVLGRGILELTDIKSAPYPGASVVPSRCRATYDQGLLCRGAGVLLHRGLHPGAAVLPSLAVQRGGRLCTGDPVGAAGHGPGGGGDPVQLLHQRQPLRRRGWHPHRGPGPLPGGSGPHRQRVHRAGAAVPGLRERSGHHAGASAVARKNAPAGLRQGRFSQQQLQQQPSSVHSMLGSPLAMVTP